MEPDDDVGQLNFYRNVLDEKIKLSQENPSIDIILCKENIIIRLLSLLLKE
jgi:hypothetical protein